MPCVFELVEGILGDHVTFFAAIGLVWLTYWVVRATSALWGDIKTFYLSDKLGLSVDVKGLGQWAVITGATDGIGKSYARCLAEKGMNIFLISRNQGKLENVAGAIENDFGVRTKCLAIDFTKDLSIYDTIKEALEGYEVGLLFNNVGLSYVHAEYFHLVDEKRCIDMVNCNVTSVLMMTKIILPQMLERRRGVIVNNSSASGYVPVPLLSAYSGTKAFVDFFSRALHEEYRRKGIFVQVILPFFVSTNMSRLDSNLLVAEVNNYARAAVKTIGLQTRTAGYFPFTLQRNATKLLGDNLAIKFWYQVLKQGRVWDYKKLGKEMTYE